jgi:hypothetical protein
VGELTESVERAANGRAIVEVDHLVKLRVDNQAL